MILLAMFRLTIWFLEFSKVRAMVSSKVVAFLLVSAYTIAYYGTSHKAPIHLIYGLFKRGEVANHFDTNFIKIN